MYSFQKRHRITIHVIPHKRSARDQQSVGCVHCWWS